jgi:archaellum component FlaC
MKVEELKQVVDANAAEMRAGFARVDERFEQIDERFEQIDRRFEQIDERFSRVDERFTGIDQQLAQLRGQIDSRAAQTERYLGVIADELMTNFTTVIEDLEARIDRKVDQKIADSEARLVRKFSKR